MRKSFFYLLMFSAVACNQKNKSADNAAPVQEKQIDTLSKSNVDTAAGNADSPCYYVWKVNFEDKSMIANPQIKEEVANIDSIINGLNCMFEKISLKKVKLMKDTLFLNIPNSDYLTQKIGSSGAAEYLAQAIINLTSVKAVKFVQLDFTEGDHAAPGIWSRKDYSDVKIVQ